VPHFRRVPEQAGTDMRIVRQLSLDIVAAGVAGGAFAMHVTGARMPPGWWLVLPASIWVIYTLDHLVDGLGAGPDAANPRHRFHATFGGALTIAMFAVGSAALAGALSWLPVEVWFAGAVVAAMAVAHVLAATRRSFPAWLPKEASVAIVYVAGLWCGPLVLAARRDASVFVALAAHVAVALAYLLLYAWYEVDVDRRDRSASLAALRGRPHVERLFTIVVASAVVLAVAGLVLSPAGRRGDFAAVLPVCAGAVVVIRLPGVFGIAQRFRAAELVLLLLALPWLAR
jgi:hypothetical protein